VKQQPKVVHLPERNPLTYRQHRREVLWQITLPLAGGGALVLAAAIGVIGAAASGTATLGRWMSVALIWLIAPALVVSLVFLIFLLGAVYALTRALAIVPLYARGAQEIFTTLYRRTRRFADAAVEPILRVQAWKAGLSALRRSTERM